VSCEEFDWELCKKQFRKLALENHPDKNKLASGCSEHFREIHQAYLFLRDHRAPSATADSDSEFTDKMITLFGPSYEHLYKKLHIMLTKSNINPVDFFDCKIGKTFVNVFRLLTVPIEVIIIRPNIDHLMEARCFKHCVGEKTLIIPTWHSHGWFDETSIFYFFKSMPHLKSNISIVRENNDIQIMLDEKKTTVVKEGNPCVQFYLGNSVFCVNKNEFVDGVKIIKNQGIPRKQHGVDSADNIFDVSEKSDIIVVLFRL
jgi:hypothetical protein